MTTQKETKTRTIHTRIKQSTWEKLSALAESDGRTVTGWLEWIVEREHSHAKRLDRREGK